MRDRAEILPLGKLPPSVLSELLKTYVRHDESVIVGAALGVDAAVIDMRDYYLVAKTDPITFVTGDIGYYAINVNANDIACMGGVPQWFLATVLLPENHTHVSRVEEIFAQLSAACEKLNISYCGGHTEVTYGINRPIVVGNMLGTVLKQNLVVNKNAAVGDTILLTKGIAIEATSIIARERRDVLVEMYSADLVERCRNFIYAPGISVLKEAQLAIAAASVHAMHDPTEGGLAMGLYELAHAAQLGLKINVDEIPIFPESKLLCEQFEIDPMGAIASGALLIVAEPRQSEKIISELKRHDVSVKIIGHMVAQAEGMKLVDRNGDEVDLPEFTQDEITKLF
ncbi:MAG: AIR synthase family protein [Candidatus Zhuqueibacterota bacterium]